MVCSVSRPELLAPAGTFEKMRIALRYGADAVYLGGSAFNLRAGASGLVWSELDQALDLAPGAYGLENEHGEKLTLVHPGLQVILRCDHPGCGPDTFVRQHWQVRDGIRQNM